LKTFFPLWIYRKSIQQKMEKQKYIQDLNSFGSETTNEASLVDFFSGVVDIAGDAIQRQLKQKVVAFLLNKLGILEKSKLSRVVQEVVEEIEIGDYYGIISGEKGADYWAPKLAKAFQGFILSEGFNNLAESWGIDSSGFLYGTIKEALEESFSDPNYQKNLSNFMIGLIGPELGGASSSTSGNPVYGDSGIRSKITKFVQGKSPSEKPTKKEAEKMVTSFVQNFENFK
jgi:hypothetical protein